MNPSLKIESSGEVEHKKREKITEEELINMARGFYLVETHGGIKSTFGDEGETRLQSSSKLIDILHAIAELLETASYYSISKETLQRASYFADLIFKRIDLRIAHYELENMKREKTQDYVNRRYHQDKDFMQAEIEEQLLGEGNGHLIKDIKRGEQTKKK